MDFILAKKPWYIRYRYYIVAGVLFAAFAIYVIVLLLGPSRLRIDADSVKVEDVKDDYFLEYVDVEGIVQPILTIKVNTLESGYVERVVAEEGQMVDVGDTILVLSNPELLRNIDDERDTWANNQRNYRQQEIEMEQKSINLRQQALDARHQMAKLDKSLAQSREEYKMGIKSKAELDVAEEEYQYQVQKTKLQMQSLRHDSVATRLRSEMVRANHDSEDKKLMRTSRRVDNLVVRATVAGQLSYVGVIPGQQVGAGSSIGEIKVLSQYKIHTSVSEYYIDRITTGLPANVQYHEKKYPMAISHIVPEVKDRQFDVDLVFTGKKPDNVRLGKSYRVQMELGKPERSVIIPRGDFYPVTGGKWIYRLSPDGKTARKVDVEIGRQNPQYYEVLSGLKPGDKVIVTGYDKFGEIEELCLN